VKRRPPSKETAPSGASRGRKRDTTPEQRARVLAHTERVQADLRALTARAERVRIEAAIYELEMEDRSRPRPILLRSAEREGHKRSPKPPKVTRKQLDRIKTEHAKHMAKAAAIRASIGREVRALLGEAS
jgi:hypothetical protein